MAEMDAQFAGSAPGPATLTLNLPAPCPVPVIALGGELKGSLCTARDGGATLHPLGGDLGQVDCFRTYARLLESSLAALRSEPVLIAHDLHPGYLSTGQARALARPSRNGGAARTLIPVQHHYAHALACMAEHGLAEPVIAVVCDGTGYGTDGAVWGCEVLFAAPTEFQRKAHLRYFALAGGDAAARETWRPAIALVRQAFGESIPDAVLEQFRRVSRERFTGVLDLLRNGACPQSSSLGRLFDAIAFLAGLAEQNDSEGHAARRLEQCAEGLRAPAYRFDMDARTRCRQLDVSPMFREIARDLAAYTPRAHIAARFHATVIEMLAQAAALALQEHALSTVVLSGGCFVNRLLREGLTSRLHERGVRRVLGHARVPCGDGGLALGQAYAAAARGRVS